MCLGTFSSVRAFWAHFSFWEMLISGLKTEIKLKNINILNRGKVNILPDSQNWWWWLVPACQATAHRVTAPTSLAFQFTDTLTHWHGPSHPLLPIAVPQGPSLQWSILPFGFPFLTCHAPLSSNGPTCLTPSMQSLFPQWPVPSLVYIL